MSLIGRMLGLQPPRKAGLPALRPRNELASILLDLTDSASIEDFIRCGGTNTKAGVAVNVESGMRQAAVYRCVTLISETVAALPLELKRRRAGVWEDDEADPVWKLLADRPNAWQTSFEFRRLLQSHVLLEGNGYAQIIRGVKGRPTDLVPLDPRKVTPQRRRDGEIVYEVRLDQQRKVVLRQRDMLHLRGWSRDGITGQSVLSAAREAVGLSAATEQHGAEFFDNGAKPSGVLAMKESLSKDAYARLKAEIAELAEPENAHKTMILEEGMTFEPVTMKASDAQWIEARGFQRAEICIFFGVSPPMIGDFEKQTSFGAGIEQQAIGYDTYTARPHLKLWEGAIHRDLLDHDADRRAQFDRTDQLVADTKSLSEHYKTMLSWGVMNPDEVRAKYGLGPRADGRGGEYYDPPNTAGGDQEPSSNREEIEPA